MNDDASRRQAGTTAPSPGLAGLARGLRVAFALLVLGLLAAFGTVLIRSFFTVEQQEFGLVLRLGRLWRSPTGREALEPGLHLTFPDLVDEKLRVPRTLVQSVTSDTFWYRADDAVKAAAGVADDSAQQLRPGLDGYLLTGDLSIMHGRWTLYYYVKDPVRYAFAGRDRNAERRATGKDEFVEVQRLLRLLLDNAVARTVAAQDLELVWRQRDKLQTLVRDRLKERVGGLDLGIEVEKVECQIAPPRLARDAFEAITQAENESRSIVNEARAEAARVVSDAHVRQAGMLSEANGFRDAREQQAKADADRFRSLLPNYATNPLVMRRMLYQEALQKVMASVEEKFIIENEPGRRLRLELGREPALAPEKPPATTP